MPWPAASDHGEPRVFYHQFTLIAMSEPDVFWKSTAERLDVTMPTLLFRGKVRPAGGQPWIALSGGFGWLLIGRGCGAVRRHQRAIDVQSSVDESVLEFVIDIDRDRAASYGFSPSQIAQALRTAVQGSKAATLRYDGEDVEVNVRQQLNPAAIAPEERTRTTIDEIRQMTLRSAAGSDVSLSSIATITAKPGTTAIQHEDGDRIAVASSAVSGTTAGEICRGCE